MKEAKEGDAQYKQVVEEIAANIARLSREVHAILSGRLKRETIVTLLAHETKMPRTVVRDVLTAIEELEKDNLK